MAVVQLSDDAVSRNGAGLLFFPRRRLRHQTVISWRCGAIADSAAGRHACRCLPPRWRLASMFAHAKRPAQRHGAGPSRRCLVELASVETDRACGVADRSPLFPHAAAPSPPAIAPQGFSLLPDQPHWQQAAHRQSLADAPDQQSLGLHRQFLLACCKLLFERFQRLFRSLSTLAVPPGFSDCVNSR